MADRLIWLVWLVIEREFCAVGKRSDLCGGLMSYHVVCLLGMKG